MAKSKRRVFITGSADGHGHAAAKTLLSQGHEVVVHVRSKERLSAVDELVAGGALIQVGCQPRWVDPALLMTCGRDTLHKSGWQ